MHLANALAGAKAGQSATVPVYIQGTDAFSGVVTLKATSESDPTKTSTMSCALTGESGTVGGTVPATLALTLGTPASFGAFRPGVTATYTAIQAANVISTAGDAALSRRRPEPHGTGPPGQRRVLAARAAARPARQGLPAPRSRRTGRSGVQRRRADRVLAAVNMNDALRTGTYAKTLTFTLSTTTP